MRKILTEDQVGKWITQLIATDRVHDFYVSKEWLKLRSEILSEYKRECQICRARGYYKKANTVHHNQYLRKHPRLALSKTYTFQGKEYKNLIPVCHDCHEELHGYRQGEKKEPLTVERW